MIEQSLPEHWHHKGNNFHSDVEMQNKRSIRGIHYLPASENERRLNSARQFDLRSNIINNWLIEDQGMTPEGTVYNLILLLTGYILFIQEQIYLKGIQSAYFLTREGDFLLEIYETLRPYSPYSEFLPIGEKLEVSRLSTFAPSLREFSISELMRIWNIYNIQSISSLIKTLSFESRVFLPLALKYNIKPDEEIKYPWLDDRVIQFIEDTEVQINARKAIELKKKTASGYFDDKFRMLEIGCNVAIIDIGWRGTIQDNIAYMYPQFNFHGLYIGLNKTLNFQPNNVIKAAYGPNLNVNLDNSKLLKFVAPIEMLTNSGDGSVVGYELNNSSFHAIRNIDKSENLVFKNYTRPIQLEILNNLRVIAPLISHQALDSDYFNPIAMKNWEGLIEKPKSDLLDAYFNSVHNETFGLGCFVKKSYKISNFKLFFQILSRKGRSNARRQLSTIGWLDGYLAWRNDRLFSRLIRILYM